MNIDQTVSFLSKNMHLVIIGLYAYVLFQIEESEYITMILLTVATCLSICYLKKSVVEGNSKCGVEGYKQIKKNQDIRRDQDLRRDQDSPHKRRI